MSIIELSTKEELQSKCYDAMVRQWETFKEHFIIEKLPIAGNLEDVVDWYFRKEPPFSNKPKEFPDAFILSALEHYHKEHKANIAVVSGDGDFKNACVRRRFIEHFPSLDEYIKAFKPELTSEDLEYPEIDPTRPITTEDLTELQAILGHGDEVTSIEVDRVLNLLKSRGTNYDYFFRHAKDDVWLEPLRDNGYFDNPPDLEEMPGGGYRIPFWPQINYLVRVYEMMPDRVLEILKNLSESSNPRILEGIMDVVLKTDSVEVVNRFSSAILSFVEQTTWTYGRINELLKKPFLFDEKLAAFTSALLNKLVGFLPDPKAAEKRARRLEILKDGEIPLEIFSEYWATGLEPLPRFEEWQYSEILEKGIRPLCKKEPYQIARILTDATASMIRLGKHPDELNQEKDDDSSQIWCQRLNASESDDIGIKPILVHTLVFACEKVYEISPESIEGLDQALGNQHWKIFKRLRQHLYSLNPNEQTLPWIREFILEHKDYDKREYPYEFQKMIRTACEHFGAHLLSEEERMAIFDAILSGLPKEGFREWMGDQFTEEGFQQWRRGFHRKQLHPFAHLLTGEYQSYFQELEDTEEKSLSDEDYSPVSQGGRVSYRSPSSPEDLAKLGDEKLLAYINDWQEEQRDEDDWLVEINIGALVGAFQIVFKDTIIPNEERLAFWMKNRDRIERPIYVRAIVQIIQEQVKEQYYEQIDLWFEFCEWVLSQPNEKSDDGVMRSDESREQPDWGRSRRAVGDFIDECLKKDMDIPFTARESLANILRLLCTQFDRRLDNDEPVFLNRNDQITEAINNTRSRALEYLVKFGFWVRRHDDTDNVSEVISILEERFKDDAKYPLTMPERALLGMYYGQLLGLNQTWAVEHKAIFFPQNDISVWIEAFGNFLRFNQPFKPTFEILRDDFVLALDHLPEFEGGEITDALGEHLFTYYLWKVYPLNGEDSLLEKFYEKTTEDRQRWAHLFDHVGRSLRNSGKYLEEDLRDRIFALFNWRLEQKEPEELQKIDFWLEAECLDPDWRLDAYSKILDISLPSNWSISTALDMLNRMLKSHTAKVVECFAKITDAIDQSERIYINTDKAKPILKAGLDSEDESVRENAERAQEILLSAGYDDFLDL